MILDARTWAAFFVDGLSGLLVLATIQVALRARLGSPGAATSESRSHLLALLLGTLLLLRMLAWILFFLVLDGYVPRLEQNGVMCAFGVVRLYPRLAQAVLWSLPASVGALLVWWAVAGAERGLAAAPFARLRTALALPIALLVAVEICLATLWYRADKFASAVTCCSAALDPSRQSDWSAHTGVFGLTSTAALLVFFALKTALVLACLWAARRGLAVRAATAFGLAAASVAVAWVGLAAWRDVFAPRALGLEFHRCAFEPILKSPVLGATALGAALAHLGLLTLVVLAGLRASEPAGAQRTADWIARTAALLLSTEILVLALHA